MKNKTLNFKNFLMSLIAIIMLSIVVRTYFITPYQITTDSMFPNLIAGDFVLGLKFNNDQWTKLNYGDLVAFKKNDMFDVTIKRIIGLPGDKIEIVKSELYINNKQIKISKLKNIDVLNPNPEIFDVFGVNLSGYRFSILKYNKKNEPDLPAFIVPQNEYFVMADNRDASEDSRDFGTISALSIESKIVYRWFSVNYSNKIAGKIVPRVRWENIGIIN